MIKLLIIMLLLISGCHRGRLFAHSLIDEPSFTEAEIEKEELKNYSAKEEILNDKIINFNK